MTSGQVKIKEPSRLGAKCWQSQGAGSHSQRQQAWARRWPWRLGYRVRRQTCPGCEKLLWALIWVDFSLEDCSLKHLQHSSDTAASSEREPLMRPDTRRKARVWELLATAVLWVGAWDTENDPKNANLSGLPCMLCEALSRPVEKECSMQNWVHGSARSIWVGSYAAADWSANQPGRWHALGGLVLWALVF